MFVFTHNSQRCCSASSGLFSPTLPTLMSLDRVHLTGFQLQLPWPTHPPSFVPIGHRLLTLLRLFVPPVALFHVYLAAGALSPAARIWNFPN